MHPLALEDLLHVRKAARSKADYYQRHLFLRILCHTLVSDEDATADTPNNSVTRLPRSSSPIPMYEDEEMSDYEDSMAKNDEDRTLSGSQPASRFATKRSGTLRTAVRRRLSKMSDVESKGGGTFALPSPRFGNTPDMQAKVSTSHSRRIHG